MRTFPSLVLACLPLLIAPTALAVPSTAPGPRPDAEPAPSARTTRDVPQTSDGVKGPIARPRPLLERGPGDVSTRKHWRVAPGITATTWDQTDARGPIRAHLLSIDWTRPGVRVDYANNGRVAKTGTVSRMVARDRAVAGVNGDFFDIDDTGAPLGIGRDRRQGLLHGRASGWNSAFSLTRSGVPKIGPLEVVTTIKQRRRMRITNLNSPSVAVGGIGAYTPSWGRTSGYRVVDGQTRNVRMVLLRKGVVVRNRTKLLPSGTKLEGRMLVGRGAGADKLRSLRKGTRASLASRLAGNPAMAITGNQFLVEDGVIEVTDDRELHPRTAIGIDRDTHRLLLLVVDGRQSFSRGYTMVELADLMIDLGADEALNLDGGGSSAMLARRPNRKVKVINSPSDGFERKVANAITVSFDRR